MRLFSLEPTEPEDREELLKIWAEEAASYKLGEIGTDEDIIKANDSIYTVENPIEMKENKTNINFGVSNYTADKQIPGECWLATDKLLVLADNIIPQEDGMWDIDPDYGTKFVADIYLKHK